MDDFFSRRHFAWLARWAGKNLSLSDCDNLADYLELECWKFDRAKFEKTMENARLDNLACAPVTKETLSVKDLVELKRRGLHED